MQKSGVKPFARSRRCPQDNNSNKPYHPTKGFRRVSQKRIEHGWRWPLLIGLMRRFK